MDINKLNKQLDVDSLTPAELKAKEDKARVNLQQYEDVSGVSTKSLDRGLWFVENRGKILNFVKAFLIFVSIVSWGYTLISFTFYLAKGMNDDSRMIRELVSNQIIGHDYVESIAAQPLLLSQVSSIKTGQKNIHDLFLKIQNPNENHWATFEYCFSNNNEDIICGESFILPSDSKFLFELSQNLTSQANAVSFSINKIDWRRISKHNYPDWEEFYNDHLSIMFNGQKFTPADSSDISEKLDINTLVFNVMNRSAYNYWEMPLNIVLYRGGTVVGINRYSISEFMSGESKKVIMAWPGKIGSVNSVEIIPDINIMNNDVYIDFEGGVGETK